MTFNNLDWTHKELRITDIRKLNKLYVLTIFSPALNSGVIGAPLFVKDTIFEERLKSYFLKDVSKIERQEIMDVKWNMYITKGYYIKINSLGEVEKFTYEPEKWYVSYLEIDGQLGSFASILKEEK
jgi:hypothetical protein